MGNCGNPCETAAGLCGEDNHFAQDSGDVDLRTIAVIGLELVQGQVLAVAYGPLVHSREGFHGAHLILRKFHEQPRRFGSDFRGDVENLAVVGKHGDAVETIGGPIQHHEQFGASRRAEAKLVERLGRGESNRRGIQNRHLLEARGRTQRGHAAGIDHRDPGDEPREKQQAEDDPQITVSQDQQLSHRREHCRLIPRLPRSIATPPASARNA